MPILRITSAVLLAASAAVAVPDSIAQGIPENFMTGEEELDSAPTAAELKIINKLTPDQVKRIDEVLLAQTALEWRKVARVVGSAMLQMKGEYPGLPDVYYSGRIAELVTAGKLQSQGNLRRMRFSEVRISGV
jgi:hypothetical protein